MQKSAWKELLKVLSAVAVNAAFFGSGLCRFAHDQKCFIDIATYRAKAKSQIDTGD